MPVRWSTVVLTGLLAITTGQPVHAGPPLVTDDPGTADFKTLEAIVAYVRESRSSGTWDQIPQLQLSYGLTERFEVGAIIPIYLVDENGSGSGSGYGHTAIGAKWRFWEDDSADFAMAVVPELLLDTAHTDVDRGPGQDAMTLSMPLLAEYSPGDWRIGTNLAFLWSRASDQWFAGGYVGYLMWDRLEWLAEITTVADRDLGNGDFDFSVGFDAKLHDRLHLIASAGRVIHNASDDRLKWQGFFGFQVIFGKQHSDPGERFGPGSTGRPPERRNP